MEGLASVRPAQEGFLETGSSGSRLNGALVIAPASFMWPRGKVSDNKGNEKETGGEVGRVRRRLGYLTVLTCSKVYMCGWVDGCLCWHDHCLRVVRDQ